MVVVVGVGGWLRRPLEDGRGGACRVLLLRLLLLPPGLWVCSCCLSAGPLALFFGRVFWVLLVCVVGVDGWVGGW